MLARTPHASIETERLRLSPPRMRDYHEWAALRRESRAHLEPFEPAWPADALSRDDWARRLRAWRAGEREGRAHVFLIRRLSDAGMIGGAALNGVRYGSVRSASIGYWLGAEETGQGLMTEAVRGLCRWAFGELGLERVDAGVVPENAASRAVLTRAGFREEGYARSYLEIAGRRRDHVLFGLVRDDLARYSI